MKKGQRFLAVALGLMIGLSLLTVSVLAAMDAAEAGTSEAVEITAAVEAMTVLATDSDTTTPESTPVVTASPGNTSSIYGDVNADGTADGGDLVRLMRCALGTAVSGDPAKGDFNRDGVVDVLDVIRLLRWLSGESVSIN